jgi:hypothetical protein
MARPGAIPFTSKAICWGRQSACVVCRAPDTTDHARRWSVLQSEQRCAQARERGWRGITRNGARKQRAERGRNWRRRRVYPAAAEPHSGRTTRWPRQMAGAARRQGRPGTGHCGTRRNSADADRSGSARADLPAGPERQRRPPARRAGAGASQAGPTILALRLLNTLPVPFSQVTLDAAHAPPVATEGATRPIHAVVGSPEQQHIQHFCVQLLHLGQAQMSAGRGCVHSDGPDYSCFQVVAPTPAGTGSLARQLPFLWAGETLCLVF